MTGEPHYLSPPHSVAAERGAETGVTCHSSETLEYMVRAGAVDVDGVDCDAVWPGGPS